jgi:MOSC domain-containing protein YiiM
MMGIVTAVNRSPNQSFSKASHPSIRLVAGRGVEGDAHCGESVQHRSRWNRDPTQPNRRQVHLIHAELFDDLRSAGSLVSAGSLGENVTTRGVDLLALPTGTLLHLGDEAVVEVTGFRNSCAQIDRFSPGLLAQVLDKDDEGNVIRKAGVMGVVVVGGEVRPGDAIRVALPSGPQVALTVV